MLSPKNLFALLPLVLPLLSSPATATASAITLKLNTFNLLEKQTLSIAPGNAPQQEKQQCSGSGSFFVPFEDKSQTLCSSTETRTVPEQGLTCPFNWLMHKEAKCCIPQHEVTLCDCGEGYTFSPSKNKCVKNKNPSCHPHEWWHKRSSTCCPEQPKNPGDCPKPKYCPSDWYWCSTTERCKPKTPRSPQPDCGPDWNEQHHCCIPPSNPSAKAQKHHHLPGHNGDQSKRSVRAKADAEAGPAPAVPAFGLKKRLPMEDQVALAGAELDAMYCPAPMKACTIVTSLASSPEWAYECMDIQTELTSCGGCASEGEGQDCTLIEDASSVGCSRGSCVVFSCESGFSNVNGTTCVKN